MCLCCHGNKVPITTSNTVDGCCLKGSVYQIRTSYIFFLIQKVFYSKYALLHTIQLLNAQFSITNSTYKHTLSILLTTINCYVS